MSPLLALGWTFLATLAFFFAWATAISAREAAKDDIVTGTVSQLVGYGLGLFLLLRVHAPETSMRRVLGVRATAWPLYLTGALLGLTLYLPVDALYELLATRFPTDTPDSLPAMWDGAAPGRRVVVALALAVIGPILEEVFFRGALFLPLRKRAERTSLLVPSAEALRAWLRSLEGEPEAATPAPPRRQASTEAIVVSAALFAAVHVEWQKLLPLVLMGAVLGWLRSRSGSLVPSILLHCAFNGVALVGLAAGRDLEVPIAAVVGSLVLAVATIAATWVIAARSEVAALARQDEP